MNRHKARVPEDQEGDTHVASIDCLDCDCAYPMVVEMSPLSDEPRELPEFLFTMPTTRPDEPPTAGMDIGPGPGSEILQNPPQDSDDEESD